MKEARPTEPWLTREEWRAGVIRSASGAKAIGLFVFTVIWNAFSWVMCALVLRQVRSSGDMGGLITLIFPLVGLVLVFPAVSGLVRWLRFRRVTFRMPEVPGVVGGPLRGVLDTGVPLPPEARVNLMLQCVHRTVTGSGKSRSTKDEILWQDEQNALPLTLSPNADGSALLVDFTIPYGLPDSSLEPSNSYHFWRLSAFSEIDGPDFEAAFEIPVFATAASRQEVTGREKAQSASAALVEAGLPAGIEEGFTTEGELQFTLRPPWTVGTNLGCLIPGVLLSVGTVVGVRFGLPAFVPVVVGVLFAAIALFIIDGVFFPRRVVLRRGTLQIKGVGLGMFTRNIPLAGVTDVTISPGVQIALEEGRHFWEVKVVYGKDRSPVTVSSYLRRKTDAERLATEILRRATRA